MRQNNDRQTGRRRRRMKREMKEERNNVKLTLDLLQQQVRRSTEALVGALQTYRLTDSLTAPTSPPLHHSASTTPAHSSLITHHHSLTSSLPHFLTSSRIHLLLTHYPRQRSGVSAERTALVSSHAPSS